MSDIDDLARDEDGSLFETASASEREKLQLKLGGYDGPLDLLLDLARRQKVDIREISMLALAEQYLAFLREARRLRLDIAADYLVMAAWLAFLKSRLLLPKPPDDDAPSGEEMAAYLAFQLERLAGLRRAAEDLFALPQLGQAFFARGEPERRRVTTRVEWTATQHELLMAYARQRTKKEFKPLHLERRSVIAIDRALLRLRRALGATPGWSQLAAYLPDEWRDDAHLRSAVASTFAAALELAKHGQIAIRQDGAFAPIYIAARDDAPPPPPAARLAEAAAAREAEPQPAQSRAGEPPRRKGSAA